MSQTANTATSLSPILKVQYSDKKSRFKKLKDKLKGK